jgi:hypothetical protein
MGAGLKFDDFSFGLGQQQHRSFLALLLLPVM